MGGASQWNGGDRNMIDYKETEKLIVNGLQAWLTEKGYNCPVIMSNQTAPVPDYPYISYTITTPVGANMKGYGVAEDGTRFKPLTQVWSFTAQSDDDIESINCALAAYDWFALVGNIYLSDNNIVAQRVENIVNRDSLVTIEYEYRRGFDVEFLLMHTIDKADADNAGYIETAEITPEMEV